MSTHAPSLSPSPPAPNWKMSLKMAWQRALDIWWGGPFQGFAVCTLGHHWPLRLVYRHQSWITPICPTCESTATGFWHFKALAYPR